VRLAAIDDLATHVCVLAERALLAALGADCHSPVAALARIEGSTIDIAAALFSEDGAHSCADRLSFHAYRPDEAGLLADRLLAQAPPVLARLFAGR